MRPPQSSITIIARRPSRFGLDSSKRELCCGSPARRSDRDRISVPICEPLHNASFLTRWRNSATRMTGKMRLKRAEPLPFLRRQRTLIGSAHDDEVRGQPVPARGLSVCAPNGPLGVVRYEGVGTPLAFQRIASAACRHKVDLTVITTLRICLNMIDCEAKFIK